MLYSWETIFCAVFFIFSDARFSSSTPEIPIVISDLPLTTYNITTRDGNITTISITDICVTLVTAIIG